jgi:hypothetical protein
LQTVLVRWTRHRKLLVWLSNQDAMACDEKVRRAIESLSDQQKLSIIQSHHRRENQKVR